MRRRSSTSARAGSTRRPPARSSRTRSLARSWTRSRSRPCTRSSASSSRPDFPRRTRSGRSYEALRPSRWRREELMADLRELYQEMILDHSRNPRNYRKVEPADRTADGTNPLCGDRVTLYLKMDGQTIKEAGFQGEGCAISKSSASMMTVDFEIAQPS